MMHEKERMTLSNSRLVELLGVATEAANEAAAHLLSGFRAPLEVEHKGRRTDLVTRFDRESEAMLLRRLEKTGLHVVGEESGGSSVRGEPTFFVDPLDGTTNFVHGHPFFAVSIGLVAPGPDGVEVPVVGVVAAPALGVVFAGACSAEGEIVAPSTRAGVPCKVSLTEVIDDGLFATGFPYDRATNPDNNFAQFVAVKRRARGVRRCGSAALDLSLVADGTYDGYWEKRLNPWDLAGGAALVRASGGRVTALPRGVLDVREGHVLATNGRVHDALAALLDVRA
jgi:myo-inositol-1(or 4)-monophosphatase